MSQENVEAVRRVYEHWARGDFFSTPEIFDSKVQTVWTDLIPDANSDVGLDALATTWTRFLAAWKDATMTAEEIREASDSVVVAICFRAKGHETGLPFDDRYGHLWTFRGDKAIRLELFRSFAEALEAVGLRE